MGVSAPITIPATRASVPRAALVHPTAVSRPVKPSSKAAVPSTTSHIPSSAKWGSTAQNSHRKKTSPGRVPAAHGVIDGVVKTISSAPVIRKTSGSAGVVTTTTTTTVTTSSSGNEIRVTPAKRQLFPDKVSKTTIATTASQSQRVPKGPLSYSSVAMGRGPGNNIGSATTGSLNNGPQLSPPLTMASVQSTSSAVTSQNLPSHLPQAISNLLSNVGQTLSPSLWQDISHPSNRPPNNLPQNPEPSQNSSAQMDQITQPVFITTPGALFTPLNQDHNSSSPPSTTESPVPTTTSSASSSPTISPIGSSLAPGSNVHGNDGADKPNLRPIGTERACRRATASPLPSMSGISPLIGGGM